MKNHLSLVSLFWTTLFLVPVAHASGPIENFVSVLTCDSGSTQIEVNTFERRQVRFVTRNQNMINDFMSKANSQVFLPMGLEGDDSGDAWGVEGRAINGIFQKDQFKSLETQDVVGNGTFHAWTNGTRLWVKYLIPAESPGTFHGVDWVFNDCH